MPLPIRGANRPRSAQDAPDSSPTADVPESRDRVNSAVREVARVRGSIRNGAVSVFFSERG